MILSSPDTNPKVSLLMAEPWYPKTIFAANFAKNTNHWEHAEKVVSLSLLPIQHFEQEAQSMNQWLALVKHTNDTTVNLNQDQQIHAKMQKLCLNCSDSVYPVNLQETTSNYS